METGFYEDKHVTGHGFDAGSSIGSRPGAFLDSQAGDVSVSSVKVPRADILAGPTSLPAADICHVQLPCSPEALATLHVGQELLLTGRLFTMRDAGHRRCLEYLEKYGQLPFDLVGESLFYAGPTPSAAGRPFGAIGPTTAARMDFAAPQLYQAGIRVTLGKGRRSAAVAEACTQTGSVYLTTVGGAASFLAKQVTQAELIAWGDLGPEALYRLEVFEFLAFVAIDSQGRQL